MKKKPLPLLTGAIAIALAASAQSQTAQLAMDPAVPLGANGAVVNYSLAGATGSFYGLLADLQGGPTDVLGARFYLGSSAMSLRAGLLPAGGLAGTIQVPPIASLIGRAIFAQACTFDTTAPNGLFHVSNGASSVFHGAPAAIAIAFSAADVHLGTFRSDVPGHLRGGHVRRRTKETIDPQGVPYYGAIASPLRPEGCRLQMVFRTQELGATGEPEVITAIRWRPFPANGLLDNSFQHVDLRAGHTSVVPNYALDPMSWLPVAPNSGLDGTFANNYLPGAPPITVFQGRYDIRAVDLTASGFMPYPAITPFAYDGVSSLLLEVLVPQDPLALPHSTAAVRLMVQSSPLPGARVVTGTSTINNPVIITNPGAVTQGQPDNAMHEMEIELVRVQTYAESRWIYSSTASLDYGVPAIAASLPFGTSLQIAYRGAPLHPWQNPTAWSSTPDIADGMHWLQYRITFFGNMATGEVPLIDTLVVPMF